MVTAGGLILETERFRWMKLSWEIAQILITEAKVERAFNLTSKVSLRK